MRPGLKAGNNNFARLKLPAGTVAPGETVTITGTIREPTAEGYRLRLDMVAELVAWFSDLGRTRAVFVDSKDL